MDAESRATRPRPRPDPGVRVANVVNPGPKVFVNSAQGEAPPNTRFWVG